MTIKIIIDSTTNLRQSTLDRVDKIVPLTVHFDQEEYLDGIDITIEEFYNKLIESDTVPTTSQASPLAFESAIKEATENGDSALIITISGKLSGTHQSALIASQNYENVYIVDSESVSIGAGILVEYALKLRDKGLNVKEIYQELESKKKNIKIIALLDTLEYLKRGGRISKTVAFAGGILNIKPVITVENGVIGMVGKARGSKKGNNLLSEEIQKSGGVNFDMPILLGYTGMDKYGLLKYIEDSKHLWENKTDKLEYTEIGSVVGTHAGPGAIAVAYFSN